MTPPAAHLIGALLASHVAMWALARTRWTWRAPRIAIITWQVLGLAWVMSVVGIPLAIGLAPYQRGVIGGLAGFFRDVHNGHPPQPVRFAAVTLGLALGFLFSSTHLTSLIRAVRCRSRHRALLVLVARRDAAAPGALVLDHPVAAAYCLPGLRATVVVSAGTLALLNKAELAAVLAHERAHAHERHDLVLLPFTALSAALPFARWPRVAYDTVAMLIEMRADDRALVEHPREPLAGALRSFAAGPGIVAPAGTIGATGQLEARLLRLAATGPVPRLRAAAWLMLAFVLLSTPVSVLG